jgi:hypothetical protein
VAARYWRGWSSEEGWPAAQSKRLGAVRDDAQVDEEGPAEGRLSHFGKPDVRRVFYFPFSSSISSSTSSAPSS